MRIEVAEEFRARLGTTPNFTILEEALHRDPPKNRHPADQMFWVADTLGEMGEGLEQAGQPDGFNRVYEGLSFDISNNFEKYRCPEALGRAAISFLDFYRRPSRAMVRFLQGDNKAFHDMNSPWPYVVLDPRLLGAPKGVQAGVGINTHILSQDLMKSLWLTDAPDEYHHDFELTVGDQIDETIDTLSPQLVAGLPAARAGAMWVLKRMIKTGRRQAWDGYEAAKLLPDDQQRETLWLDADRSAAAFNNRFLAVGGRLLRAVELTDLSSWRRDTARGNEEDEQQAA